MAKMTITKHFTAKHGSKSIIQSDYEIGVSIRGPIVLGFTKHCDSISLENMLIAVCNELDGSYLDERMGRATHEMVGLWIYHRMGTMINQVSVNADGILVIISKEDYLAQNYEATLLLHKAMTAFLKENLQDAEKLINKSIQIDDQNVSAYLVRGRIYRYTERYEQAANDFCRVISFCPQWSEGHRNLGNMYLFLGEYEKMIPCFLEAVRLAPNSSLAHNNLGYAYEQKQEYTKAYFHCSNAVKLNPEYSEAHMDLSNVCKAMHRYDEAMLHQSIANKLMKQHPVHDRQYHLADTEGFLYD